LNIAIVVSEFNDNVTSRMHKVALEKARELKLNVKYECKVPGVFDMPLVIDTLLQKNDIDAVVTLGAIIKGQTKHDELIASVVAGKNFQIINKISKTNFPWNLWSRNVRKAGFCKNSSCIRKGS